MFLNIKEKMKRTFKMDKINNDNCWIQVDSPLGRLSLAANSEGLTKVCFGHLPEGVRKEASPILRHAIKELDEYWEHQRRVFSVPLSLTKGTFFQKEVWKTLLKIPYGETRSYGWVAQKCSRPKAARAVGAANHQNPLPLFIPCHRVIGANGALVGYAPGLENKEFLLNHEQMG